MILTLYITFFLTLRLAASPVEMHSRGLASYTGGNSVPQQGQQVRTSGLQSSSLNGVGTGLVGEAQGMGTAALGGGVSGTTPFSQPYPSSQSSSTVIESFTGIGSQLCELQNMVTSGSVTQQIAVQRMTQVATSFEFALSQAPMCFGCFNQETFSYTVSGVFQRFTQVMTVMQTSYTAAFPQICAPFVGIQSSFKTFFNSVLSSGIALNRIVPPALPALLGGVMPELQSSLSEFGF